MKKIVILAMVMVLTVLTSIVMAAGKSGDNGGVMQQGGESAKLDLFQKCDSTLIGTAGYDSFGCPAPGNGPWPIFLGNRRTGKLEYSPWGDKFKFSFEGKNLLPKTKYTLIYYSDPWPGSSLICLGSGSTNNKGNIKIKGKNDIGTSLPVSTDANYNPVPPSGAVGAKIWLVLSADVQCTAGSQMMINWNPTAYLFEYNLIIYTRTPAIPDEEDD